jgi:sugar phosphate permease
VAFAGSVLLGFAPSVFWAVVGRTLVGLGVSMLFVSTMKILAEWFKTGEFAFMTGILMAMGGIGSLTAATPLALLSAWIGWRMSFIAVGLFSLLLALLVWMVVRDRPADLGWPSPSETVRADAPAIGLAEGVRTVVGNLHFWPLAGWFFFDCAVFFSFGGLWGGPYLMQIYGLTKAQAGQILSMMALGMVVGSPMLSYVSNNILHGRKPVLVACSAAVLCLTVPLAFFTGAIPRTGLYLICLGLGIFSSAVVVIGFTAAKELFPVQIAGTAVGLVNLFPFAGGALAQPFLGFLLERHGRVDGQFAQAAYAQAFLALFISAALALTFSIFVKETLVTE